MKIAIVPVLLWLGTTGVGRAQESTSLFPPFGTGHQAKNATWASAPTLEQVRHALPRSVTFQGRTRWRCPVDIKEKLSSCTMPDAWPRDERYEKAGRKLSPQIHSFSG